MTRERNFSNPVMDWLRANRPDLLTQSGAINGSLRPTAQEVIQYVERQLPDHLKPEKKEVKRY